MEKMQETFNLLNSHQRLLESKRIKAKQEMNSTVTENEKCSRRTNYTNNK